MVYEKVETENKVFLDMENILDQKIFEETDFNNIWANLRSYGIEPKKKAFIFVDEIQQKPDVIHAVKYLYDHYDAKFFLTGSSSFYLKNLFPESLAGRKFLFELFPCDFEEFLIFKEEEKEFYLDFEEKDRRKNPVSYERYKKRYEEYLVFGGFPQVALASDEKHKALLLKDIFSSYFEKDVKTLADFKHLHAFRDLLLLLMQRAGSKLEIAKLASEIGVSRETVYSYLAFLEGTYFIFLVRPFSRNVDREVSGAKKVYFCDNGFLSQFARVSEGTLLENAVFLNFRKYGAIHYYQKRSGAEIDFLVPEKKLAVEVKRSAVEKERLRMAKIAESLGMESKFIVTQVFSSLPGVVPALDV
jgi:predicted AAA+ superfamily ATPase